MREPAFPLFHQSPPQLRLPEAFFRAVRRSGTRLTEHVLWVVVSQQHQFHFRRTRPSADDPLRTLTLVRKLVISTSRFGIGQTENSNQTPLGLHAIAEKIGAGWPAGTVFKGRRPVGYTWKGLPDAKISTRILWLQGLDPGFNRGGSRRFPRPLHLHPRSRR